MESFMLLFEMTPNEGRLYQKEYHGGDNQVSDSSHLGVTACCNASNELSRI